MQYFAVLCSVFYFCCYATSFETTCCDVVRVIQNKIGGRPFFSFIQVAGLIAYCFCFFYLLHGFQCRVDKKTVMRGVVFLLQLMLIPLVRNG